MNSSIFFPVAPGFAGVSPVAATPASPLGSSLGRGRRRRRSYMVAQTAPKQRSRLSSSGFTLVEVLATLMLLGIVLPAVNMALISASTAGESAKNRTQAASLAQSKLSEMITGYTWNGGGPMSGDFGNEAPGFRWQAAVNSWTDGTQNVAFSQLDIKVLWNAHNREESITVSSLVYIRPVPAS